MYKRRSPPAEALKLGWVPDHSKQSRERAGPGLSRHEQRLRGGVAGEFVWGQVKHGQANVKAPVTSKARKPPMSPRDMSKTKRSPMKIQSQAQMTPVGAGPATHRSHLQRGRNQKTNWNRPTLTDAKVHRKPVACGSLSLD